MACVSLKHAILGFLEIEPTTGYTLQLRFDGSVGSFWTATQSQIYRELHALERDRLVEVEVVPQEGKPPRKVYALTASGRAELRRWLAEPVGPMQIRDPVLLKFVFAAELAPDLLDDILAGYERSLDERRAEYDARLGAKEIFDLARSERERELWKLSIENGLAWCDAQLAWVARARKRLGRLPPHKPKKKGKSS
jgi:PadR family transcriptional regulator, regulatory protein AphA